MGGHTQRSGPCFSSDHKKRFLSRYRAHLGIRKCTAKLRKEWTILDIIETRNKWRTSFNKYIKNKWQKVVYNNKSGSGKKTFQHEDLCEAIWGHRPSTTPLNVGIIHEWRLLCRCCWCSKLWYFVTLHYVKSSKLHVHNFKRLEMWFRIVYVNCHYCTSYFPLRVLQSKEKTKEDKTRKLVSGNVSCCLREDWKSTPAVTAGRDPTPKMRVPRESGRTNT